MRIENRSIKLGHTQKETLERVVMRFSILNRLLASGGRIWRSKSSGYGSELGGRMLISTMSKTGAPPSPPWLMLPPGRGRSGDIAFNFYNLAEERQLSLGGGFPSEAADNIRFVGSSHGWLALFNDRTNALFLTNPVSGRRINLPSTDDNVVSRVVLSCSPDEDEDECRAIMSFVPPKAAKKVAKRVVDDDDYDPDTLPPAAILARCLPVMSLGPAESLAFCTTNGSANGSDWTPIGTGRVTTYGGDFVYSRRKGQLFCLTTSSFPEMDYFDLHLPETTRPNLSDVEVWDLSNAESPRIETRHSLNELPRLIKDSSGMSERRYLVYSELSDQLYLIRRHMMDRVDHAGKFVKNIYFYNRSGWDNSYPYKTVGFDIHMVDNEGKLLVGEKVSLDNMAIFIGINHGLVMEDADQFQLNSNSIYFTDDTIHTPPNRLEVVNEDNVSGSFTSKWIDSSPIYGGHDIGIFDCQNKTISPCFYPIDPSSLKRLDPPPLWFTPQDIP